MVVYSIAWYSQQCVSVTYQLLLLPSYQHVYRYLVYTPVELFTRDCVGPEFLDDTVETTILSGRRPLRGVSYPKN